MNEPNILIKEALRTVVSGINKGLTPTDALAKAASEFDLNPQYIQRVGEATNVALHHYHFKKAADRSSDFPIADIPKVIGTAFTATEKTAAQKTSDWFQSASLHEEIPNFNKYKEDGVYKKAYLKIVETGKGAEHTKYAMSLKGLIEKSAHYIQNLKKTVEQKHTDKVAADTRLDGAFAALVNHFSKTSHVRTPWHDIESQVFAKHGEAAVPYLDMVYKTAGLKDGRGIHDAKHWNFTPCKEAAMFENLFKAAKLHVQAEQNYKEAQHNLNFEKSYHDEIWAKPAPIKKNAEDDLALIAPIPAPEKVAEKGPEGPVSPTVDDESEKFAFSIMDVLLNKFQDSVESKDHSRPNPLANTSGDDMQRKMVLQELIMTDPLLHKEPPQKIVAAYQQLLRIAPELAKEKEVVRSLLREMMATQSLNPHTSNQLTEANLNLMKQKMMQQGYKPQDK